MSVVLLRWRRSSEDELSSAMAPAALGAGMAAAAGEEEGRGNEKWSVEGCRADAGGVKAAPRRVVACADRPAAMRGRFPRHAARGV